MKKVVEGERWRRRRWWPRARSTRSAKGWVGLKRRWGRWYWWWKEEDSSIELVELSCFRGRGG